MEKVRIPDNVKQKGKIQIDIIIIASNLSFYQLRQKTPKIYQSKSTKFLLALILPKGVRASWERDWFVNFWERESIKVETKKWSEKITFHVWSLIILLTNTARVKVLSSIMKMQILDQKMQNAGSRAFMIHKWIFLHICYTSFKIRPLCIFLLGIWISLRTSQNFFSWHSR